MTAAGERLTALDDSLRHTSPLTFDQVATTDPRFFDRVWYTGIPPVGSPGVMFGIAAYANMNVMDGYACAIDGTTQHNLRFSRYLRPDIDRSVVGPFAFDVTEPMIRQRACLEPNASGLEFDLEFTAGAPPHLERPHQRTAAGRVVQDYRRYGQSGVLNGTVRLQGRPYPVEDWFSMRDHAWGVRRHVGGVEPYLSVTDDFGGLFIWIQFSAGSYTGNLQIIEDGDGTRRYFDGVVDDGHGDVKLTAGEYHLEIPDGSRIFDRAWFEVTGSDGEEFIIDTWPAHEAWVLRGTGYDHGFTDGLGHGADRGALLIEHDRYELLGGGQVRFPSGTVEDPWHREYGAHVEIGGERGRGHVVVLLEGDIRKLGRSWPRLGAT